MAKIDFRKQIKRQMKKNGIGTAYALSKSVNHKITVGAIDNFLSGRSEMTAKNLEIILEVFGGRLVF